MGIMWYYKQLPSDTVAAPKAIGIHRKALHLENITALL